MSLKHNITEQHFVYHASELENNPILGTQYLIMTQTEVCYSKDLYDGISKTNYSNIWICYLSRLSESYRYQTNLSRTIKSNLYPICHLSCLPGSCFFLPFRNNSTLYGDSSDTLCFTWPFRYPFGSSGKNGLWLALSSGIVSGPDVQN